ncbi:MAG: pyruvate formate lyase family protein [Mycobacterium leprae]
MSTALPTGLRDQLTERTKRLRDALQERGFTNRSGEWFQPEMLPDIAAICAKEPVIVRRARAIQAMLEAMTTPAYSVATHTYEIFDGELLVGTMPLGSHGLGKVFPNYLTPDEKRVASVADRSQLSLLGHNTVNYETVLSRGMRYILAFCDRQIGAEEAAIADEEEIRGRDRQRRERIDFYRAVKISCEAVVAYAGRFADLAGQMAEVERDATRQAELREIERICRKVPMEPAETFYEALQSILFVHTALHASMDFMSLGRLDQVLQPYLEHTVRKGVTDLDKAVELVESLALKLAWRLNFTTEYLVEQDHIDFSVMLGTHSWYTDQRAIANNYLQNVVLGGKKPDGSDGTNPCTLVMLQGFRNVNLPAPGLYVRLSKESPTLLRERVAESIAHTGNIPVILNDDVIIPALYQTLNERGKQAMVRNTEFNELANDFTVDGCWEPILNGKSDWTFCMVHGMPVMECTLNNGAMLDSDSSPAVLRGSKRSYRTGEINSYGDLLRSLRQTMGFFVDQMALGMYVYYMIDEYLTPTPLFSALSDSCLERGRDKSWGGMRYCLGGTILSGVPNMVNELCAIKKWVFDEQRYTFAEVVEALRHNFTVPKESKPDPVRQQLYNRMQTDFSTNSPQFGNNDPAANEMCRLVLDLFDQAVQSAKALGDEVFLKQPTSVDQADWARRLRLVAGYYGPALEARFGSDFDIRFTAGLGSFEIYNLLGKGAAASADRRRDDPIAMNFSPTPGTVHQGIGNVLASLNSLGLERFAAGAVTDLCLNTDESSSAIVSSVIEQFLANGGHSASITIGSRQKFQEIYEQSVKASQMADRQAAAELLKPYRDVTVRIGGWQCSFIAMSLDQQKAYLNRPI